MDDQIIKLAEETLGRYNALTEELSDPNIFSDQRRYREVAKEHARLRRGAELCQALLDSVSEMREARELVPSAAAKGRTTAPAMVRLQPRHRR
jgi:peptide chain release factor 1